ncbi:MAG: ABC transporter ATP-binding protein [Elusimicrobiota bacterium]
MELKPLLLMEGVTHSFGSGRPVFENISFSLKEGEFLGIVGASGAGKSSLLNLAAGLDAPRAGRILYRGGVVAGPSPDRVLLFQDHSLFPWRTALENVAFPLKAKGVNRPEREAEALKGLSRMRLEEHAGQYPHSLSGGMRQRVAIARALAASPDLLLLDEPFSSLDPFQANVLQDEIFPMLRGLKKSLLYVTHNMEDALRRCDRVLVLAGRPAQLRGEFAAPGGLTDELEIVERKRRILDAIAGSLEADR